MWLCSRARLSLRERRGHRTAKRSFATRVPKRSLGTRGNDADLTSSNIRNGIDLFGVTGSSYVANTATGDAASGDIRSGKKAWVDGVEITGTATIEGSGPAAGSQNREAELLDTRSQVELGKPS